ncbi:hypothetical protein BO223_09895 [Faecalibaculum rodentium]|uniref:Uncharacterized protein n=1 Tax=Faecalibaculum rodentium TaxID=1702221 RepID=A0A1Q9YI67_9FIRM|nr:hypothetical protein BO223_09895 [Faecalibaculum rodentium]
MKTGCMPVRDADEAEGQEKAACFYIVPVGSAGRFLALGQSWPAFLFARRSQSGSDGSRFFRLPDDLSLSCPAS